MLVSEAVGRALVSAGVDHAFGVVGSGNFHVTNAMSAAGARYVAARHEGGAATMADAYARMSGRPAVLTVHQGCGLTNAMTGIAEAAKSRTPLVVVAAEVVDPRSNFYIDQDSLVRSVGAVPLRITSAETAVQEAVDAVALAVHRRCSVVLNLPLHIQALKIQNVDPPRLPPPATPLEPSGPDVARLASALASARRPVFVAGRGARSPEARTALAALAQQHGALLATSAVAKGLFHDDPWSLDVSGGFSSPVVADLIAGADVIVGWGCALNNWTMRNGALVAAETTVVQVDDTPEAIGVHRELSFGVLGDVTATARAVAVAASRHTAIGYRTAEVADRLASALRWRDVPFNDLSGDGRIDPRTLSITLDDMLPVDRIVGVDSGNFMGYPSMFLSVPDERGFCFTQAFQSIGMGLATTIGAALAQPDRIPVAALGDGGALMMAAEFDTVRRLQLPMVVIVYNDDAYGAEAHHFSPGGDDLSTVTFPDTDIAAIARGFGFTAVTVRSQADFTEVQHWLEGARDTPLLIDAKVVSSEPAWWLEEGFRGH